MIRMRSVLLCVNGQNCLLVLHPKLDLFDCLVKHPAYQPDAACSMHSNSIDVPCRDLDAAQRLPCRLIPL